ncbi:MAG TPA: hypothetical protein RMH99_31975 [Sandaracinaceae bacterium LLY-WYZ-13_1]|nr:hypothetical protein [Sandaracinaceae bacterium LLY-WYZ-13_1]
MNALTRTGLAFAALGLVLGACSSTHYVTIRHPLHVGQVDPNEVPFNARREERPRGLPAGTLTDSASLTEVTPERICMQTNLWSLDEVNPDRGMYQNYRIALLNDQDEVENTDAQVQMGQPVTQQYNGFIERRVPAGYRRVCAARRNRRCVRYTRQRVYVTRRFPHVWQVTNYPANICFPNGGFVTPSTTRVALEVDGRGPGRMVFEWQFESAVAGGQPQQQQQ